jgi:ABC-type nickel/cobalt efflux system permease component RcnA
LPTEIKSEIRISKSETNPKYEIAMTETPEFPFCVFAIRISDLFRISRFGFRISAIFTLVLASASAVAAHPVPKDTHDRTVIVRLERRPQESVTVRVKYRLEVDQLTADTKDLEPYVDEIDAFKYRGKPEELLYGELARRLGPDLAFRLVGKANGQRLEFKCVGTAATLHDNGLKLGHLRCDFEFEANFALLTNGENKLLFRDHTYLGEEGKIDLSFLNDGGYAIQNKTVPDDAVKKRSPLERESGDDDKLREIRVVFLHKAAEPAAATPPQATPPAGPQAGETHDDHVLWRLLFHSDYGFWLTMLMAVIFGAAHALTPGHGKTLVAAYLVGQRGTVGHALVLGIVTTLTHTGVVMLIAGILFFLPDDARASFGRAIHDGLGLAMGLLVVCMGVWLLLQRLSGRADHFHVGGGHHHHHHEPSGSAVPEVSDQNAEAQPGALRWGGLILLGITGGLVPCWDAIYLLLYTVGRSQFAIALPAVLAFSAGLAGVLVLIGILVVQVPRFAQSRLGYGKIVRALPIVSAVVVTLMGLWLCYEGVHGR